MNMSKKKTKLTEEEMIHKELDMDYARKPRESYSESEDVIEAANKTLSQGRKFKSEVERQEFMKMNSSEKASYIKDLEERMKKRRQGK